MIFKPSDISCERPIKYERTAEQLLPYAKLLNRILSGFTEATVLEPRWLTG